MNISKGVTGKARLKDMIENHVAFPAELRAGLVGMVAHAQTVQRDLKNVTKILEELAKKDKK